MGILSLGGGSPQSPEARRQEQIIAMQGELLKEIRALRAPIEAYRREVMSKLETIYIVEWEILNLIVKHSTDELNGCQAFLNGAPVDSAPYRELAALFDGKT
jgi:hypothetical protein